MNDTTKDLLILNSIPGFGYKKLKESSKQFLTQQISKAKKFFDVEKEIELINKEKINIITIFDKEYPEYLKQIHSPPIVLYTKGQLENLNKSAIAVVGSRRCTHYGKSMTRRICSSLAKLDIIIVSGMARGIDTAAHKETLAAGGKTTAVLGSGLNHIYPSENKRLSEEIAQNGVLISEFTMDTPPLKENFPRRNRIISGLSKAVVVIEAPEKSGALITADFALEQGREVFAVPGSADSYNSKGSNNLIKQGAKLVNDVVDIIEELFPELLDKKKQAEEEKTDLSNIAAEDRRVYELLSNEPIDIDSLAEKLDVNPQQVMLNLLHLELAGLTKQLPGKLFVRT